MLSTIAERRINFMFINETKLILGDDDNDPGRKSIRFELRTEWSSVPSERLGSAAFRAVRLSLTGLILQRFREAKPREKLLKQEAGKP